MVASGLALSSDPTWHLIAATLIAAGGVLLSVHPASAYARRDAEAAFHARLDTLVRQLAISSGQIDQAALHAQTGTVDAETCFALIRQASRTLFGLVDEMRAVRGARFDPSETVQTVETLLEMAEDLNSYTDKALRVGRLEPAATQELQELKVQIAAMSDRLAVGAAPSRSSSAVKVDCLQCGTVVPVVIGDAPGVKRICILSYL